MTPEAPQPVPTGAPWLAIWRREFAADAHGSLAQAATISPTGDPEVRTVVLRGLSADGCPYFTTDARSDKARAVRAGSNVALCVWWSDSSTQIRLRGPATMIGDAEAGAWKPVRDALWAAHRDTERRGFTGPPPGTRLGTATDLPAAPDRTHPNFAILIVTPTRFDRLELGDPHVRHAWEWSEVGGWQGGRLAP